jgi:hypothetical protein
MQWIQILNDIEMKEDQNLDDLMLRSKINPGDDVGLIHAKTGAGILARDNGRLEGFADTGLGFRMDPQTHSFSLFAPTISFFCFDFKVYDKDNKETLNRINNEFADVLQLIGGKIDG